MTRSSTRLIVLAALAVSSCSLLAADYSRLGERIRGVPDETVRREVLAELGENPDVEVRKELASLASASSPEERAKARERIEDLVGSRAISQGAQRLDVDLAPQIREAKKRSGYREAETRPENFVTKALERLRNLRLGGNRAPSGVPRLEWMVPVAWTLLGAVVLAFLVFALGQVRWLVRQRRRGRPLMEEEEPAATADEWLERADALTAQGKHREAVRCLYFACLLRVDEAGIARFVRGETNWEHYRRIQKSPHRPADMDFLIPTQTFDRVWYGFAGYGLADVEYFRDFYQVLLDQIRGRPRL